MIIDSFVQQSNQKLQFIRYRLSLGLSTSVRLQGGPVDLQSLTMWYAVWGSPHWHRLSSPNPHFTIESPNFLIPVHNRVVGPRLSKEGHFLGVCFTRFGCVVAVYVLLVLAGGRNLVDSRNGRRGL